MPCLRESAAAETERGGQGTALPGLQNGAQGGGQPAAGNRRLLDQCCGDQLPLDPSRPVCHGGQPGDSAAAADEQPRMTLTIPRPFWAATFPLTNALVRRFLENAAIDDDPRLAKLRKDRSFASQVRRGNVDDSLPAVEICHDDAQILCAWLRGLDGRHYRLPVEAEWEYMARAGTAGPYWRDAGGAAEKLAVFAATGAAPADPRRANPWGLIDVLGNVAEWTASAYAGLDSGATLESADGLGGDARVVRGGSWRAKMPEELRVSRRRSMFRRMRADDLGVRIVCDLEDPNGADQKELRS